MSKKQELENIITELKELIEVNLKNLEEINSQKEFNVMTPVDIDGDILFNNNEQILSVPNPSIHYEVGSIYTADKPHKDHRADFKWVECKRKDFERGDIAYRCDHSSPSFAAESLVCVILGDREDVYTLNGTVIISVDNWEYWYKLVKRE